MINATFETALEYMDEALLSTLRDLLLLPVPMAICATEPTGGPPGAFFLVPQGQGDEQQWNEVARAYRRFTHTTDLTDEDRAEMLAAVEQTLAMNRDESDDHDLDS